MADFALVTFKENITVVKSGNSNTKSPAGKLFGKFIDLLYKAGFFRLKIGTGIFFHFKKDELKKGIRTIILYDNVRVLVIELPIQRIKYAHFNHIFIENYIHKVSKENGIDFCMLPDSIRRENQKPKYGLISKILLKSLLVDSLAGICQKAGIRMENVDIVIITADKDEELIAIVKMLEPYIKFVTVLTSGQNKNALESRLSELFLDTGLSFNVCTDYKGALKNAKFIINQGSLADICKFRFNRKSLLINLNEAEDIRLQGENVVINGVVFEMSDKGFKDFLYELRGLYNKKEICEIALIHKLEMYGEYVWNDMNMDKIQREFKKGNCRIIGFEGQRGIILLENIAKSIIP